MALAALPVESIREARSVGEARPVVRAIVDLIRERRLAVGDQLPSIRELAVSLGVKPTLVRDGLLQAQTMGLLRVLPRSGAFVQSLSYAPLVEALKSTLTPALMQADPNLFHLLDSRRLLEIELAGRAADRRRLEDLLPLRRVLETMNGLPENAPRAEYVEQDVRFHVEIARLAGNGVLLTVQQALLELLRPHLVQLPWTRERRQCTDGSHAAIYAAVVAGDAESARAEMREHLSMAYDNLLRDVQSLPAGANGNGRAHAEEAPV